MDRDRSVPKPAGPDSVDPPIRQTNAARSGKMKTKVFLAVVALSYAPLGVAGNKAAYPKEKVAAFVVEKLDLTSLPSTFRPKKEKGKKTFADYRFTAQTVDENEAVVEAEDRVKRLQLKVLDERYSGSYVCVADHGETGVLANPQRVILL